MTEDIAQSCSVAFEESPAIWSRAPVSPMSCASSLGSPPFVWAASTAAAVRAAISGDLCRCTGYQGIVRSILRAAGEVRTCRQRAGA
jgi:aerobic-type carbon monoxide dehydrogenase small subunit (CoxS/CutS family)